jgi:hypothetical protein
VQRGPLAAAGRAVGIATVELDSLGGVLVAPLEVVLLGRPGAGARVRRAGPLVAVGQLVDVALQDAAAVDALAVLLAGAPLTVVVVGVVRPGTAVVVPMVAVVTITVSVTLALTLTVPLPVAVSLSIAFPVPVTITITVIAIAVVAPIAFSITVMFAIPIPLAIPFAVADGGRPAIREQDVGGAGLAVITLTLGDGMATLRLIRVVLWAAAPHRTRTAAMRSLTSVTITIRAVTAALALPLGIFLLLLEPSDMLLESASSGLIGAYSLEGGHVSQPAPDLLVSVIDANRGLHPFHVRTEVLQSATLLAVRLSILIRALGPLLDLLRRELVSKRSLINSIQDHGDSPAQR